MGPDRRLAQADGQAPSSIRKHTSTYGINIQILTEVCHTAFTRCTKHSVHYVSVCSIGTPSQRAV